MLFFLQSYLLDSKVSKVVVWIIKTLLLSFKEEKKVLATSNAQQNALFLVHFSDPVLTQILKVGFPGKSL